MNKKLVLLLIPLMLIPLASFAYAHFYDQVYKQYKIHLGSVEAKLEFFNVTKLKMIDLGPECGHLVGVLNDEFNYTVEYLDSAWYINITVDPAPPGFWIETEMLIHNVGKLPWRIQNPVVTWDGNYTTDPCFDATIANTTDLPDWITFEFKYYMHDDVGTAHPGKGCFDITHYTIPVGETEVPYCNCSSVRIWQRLRLLQSEIPQKAVQCTWWRIVIKYEVVNDDADWQAINVPWWNP